MFNTTLIQQEIETESELEEERVPTPEVMKKDNEDLDTDQVKPHVQSNQHKKKDEDLDTDHVKPPAQFITHLVLTKCIVWESQLCLFVFYSFLGFDWLLTFLTSLTKTT